MWGAGDGALHSYEVGVLAPPPPAPYMCFFKRPAMFADTGTRVAEFADFTCPAAVSGASLCTMQAVSTRAAAVAADGGARLWRSGFGSARRRRFTVSKLQATGQALLLVWLG